MTTHTFHNGDAAITLARLPAKSVQCCVTSPPYYGLRNYDVDGQIGQEKTPDAYVLSLVGVFREVKRVLRDDGLLFLNLGDSYAGACGGPQGASDQMADRTVAKHRCRTHSSTRLTPGLKPKDLIGIPWRVAFALQTDGWYLRSAIVWAKPNPMPGSQHDRPTSSYEMVFMMSKKPTYFYDEHAIAEDSVSNHPSGNGFKRDASVSRQNADGTPRGNDKQWTPTAKRTARDVWTITSKPFKGAHFATMPVDLAMRCISAGSSEAGCCAICQSPLHRVVEKGDPDLYHQIACGASQDGSYDGMATKDYAGAGAQNASDVKRRILEGMREKRTIGWNPTCRCLSNRVEPCVILDPFAGAGTTALAANNLGRSSIGIDLNADYIPMAHRRLGITPDVMDITCEAA